MSRLSPASRRALLGWGALAGVLVALAFGRGASAQEAGGAGEVEGAARGALLYAAQCAQCHGADGQGGPVQGRPGEGQAPALRHELNPDVTAAYLYLVMATGRMPPAEDPFDNRPRNVVLDEAQIVDVVDWMTDEFDIPGEIPEVGEGDAVEGQDVYNTNCAHCHGNTGAGGVAGAGAWTPKVNDASAEVIAAAIRVGPFQMPEFREEQISDEEIADVAAFMREVEAEPGTPLLGLVELNPVFASAFVFLLAVAMLLSLMWIGGRPNWFPDPPKAEGEPEVPAGATRRRPEQTPTEESA
jgi:ubiquinol-cytochrome c reductase cytochrome c subunit